MPDGVLYFPYMRVPADAWFTRVLLYWDRIAVIVPSAHVSDKPMLGAYTQTLIARGLVAAVSPDKHYIFQGSPMGSCRCSKRTVTPDPATAVCRRSPATGAQIHVSKMGVDLFRELEDRHLARHDRGHAEPLWYAIEPQTARLFMAYLAVVLGQLEGMSPITTIPLRSPYSMANARASHIP